MLLDLFKPKDKKKHAFHHLRQKLHAHHRRAVSHLHTTHRHVAHLAKKHKVHIHRLRHHGQRAAATAVLSTSLMAAVPAADIAKQKVPTARAGDGFPTTQEVTRSTFPGVEQTVPAVAATPDKAVPEVLTDILGEQPEQHFTPEQETAVSELFRARYGVAAFAELEGKRLNVVHGLIGGEQHLKRYPGDTVDQHKNNIDQRPELAGIAPGLGGWGYFAPGGLTQEAIEQEKFYIAAQTFAAPGWKENVREMARWFRFRKVLVVNPKTGQGCVAVIGDAGPGLSTKKNFGGSPEVMDAVGWSRGSRKGPVIVYFVDDPENKIPLGHLNPDGGKRK